jgi:hypothetical protein
MTGFRSHLTHGALRSLIGQEKNPIGPAWAADRLFPPQYFMLVDDLSRQKIVKYGTERTHGKRAHNRENSPSSSPTRFAYLCCLTSLTNHCPCRYQLSRSLSALGRTHQAYPSRGAQLPIFLLPYRANRYLLRNRTDHAIDISSDPTLVSESIYIAHRSSTVSLLR